MADGRLIPVGELSPGDRLGQDIMAGSQVLLRQGAVLSDAQIAHIMRLGLKAVLVMPQEYGGAAAARPEQPRQVQISMPDFRQLSSETEPSWMSGEFFSQPVARPAELSATEKLFAERKLALREKAGLTPLVNREKEADVSQGLQSALILSAMTNRVDLERIDELALELAKIIDRETSGYLEMVDVSRYGESLSARSMMSAKVFSVLRTGNGTLNFPEQLRGHLALCSVFALVPDQLSQPVEDMDEEALNNVRELVQRYGEWLREQHFVGDETLELVLMRFERYDGSGVPRGLSGDEIHEVGHAWALAWSYCDRLVSKPSRPRKTAQGAADELARQAGRAFSPTGINRFLRTVGLFPAGSLVQLSDGRLAVVVRQNERALFRPVVRVTDGAELEAAELDLTEHPGVFIQQQVLEY